MNDLYQAIAALCREQGVSTSAICKKAGISPGIVSDLKNGRKKSVSAETLARLARALGVSSEYLLSGGAAGAAESGRTLDAAPPPPEDDLIACYGEVSRYLDDADRNDLMTLMRLRAEMKKAHDKD